MQLCTIAIVAWGTWAQKLSQSLSTGEGRVRPCFPGALAYWQAGRASRSDCRHGYAAELDHVAKTAAHQSDSFRLSSLRPRMT